MLGTLLSKAQGDPSSGLQLGPRDQQGALVPCSGDLGAGSWPMSGFGLQGFLCSFLLRVGQGPHPRAIPLSAAPLEAKPGAVFPLIPLSPSKHC